MASASLNELVLITWNLCLRLSLGLDLTPLQNLVDALHARLVMGLVRTPAVQARVPARSDRGRDGHGGIGAVEAELLLPEQGRAER